MNRHPVFESLGAISDEPKGLTSLVNAAGTLILEAEAALDMFEETATYMARANPDLIGAHVRYFISRVQMTGKAFVATLARLGRVLKALSETDPRYAPLWEEFKATLPAITDVRDSNEHIEDRARGLRRVKRRKIPIAHLHNPRSIVITENVMGREYTTLLADGTEGKVHISAETLAAAHKLTQKAFELHAAGRGGG